MFNAVQSDIKAQFDNTANIIKTIKKASEVIASFSNNMLKTPNLVGKPQAKPQAQAPQVAQPSNAEK
jgi:MoxR-like ATPase